jgi:hypothetical protein
MTDFATFRADRPGRLVRTADVIVGWQVRYQAAEKTYQKEFDFEADATAFYSAFETCGIECSLEPIWGWIVETSKNNMVRIYDYEIVVKTGGYEYNVAVGQDKELAEDQACQMRLGGVDATVKIAKITIES